MRDIVCFWSTSVYVCQKKKEEEDEDEDEDEDDNCLKIMWCLISVFIPANYNLIVSIFKSQNCDVQKPQ